MSEVLTSMILSEQQSIALLNMLSSYVPENAVNDSTLVIPNTNDFGGIFRRERQKLNITSRYVAECLGFSSAWVSKVERGQITVDLPVMKKLVKLIGYSYVCIGID